MSTPLFSETDYLILLQNLLPEGPAFPRDPSSVQTALLSALAQAQSDNQAIEANLLIDAFPSTTVQLLPEWEESLGLPDPCLGDNPTLQQRQNSVVTRIIAAGGQSIPYLESVCASLGYPGITFTEFTPYTVGMPVGGPIYGTAWAYALQINNYEFPVEYFLVGRDTAGEPLATWGNSVLVCELRRVAPAHVVLIFAYTE